MKADSVEYWELRCTELEEQLSQLTDDVTAVVLVPLRWELMDARRQWVRAQAEARHAVLTVAECLEILRAGPL